jgi:hypothetical protein
VFKAYLVGLLGALAALMVGAAIWSAVRSLDRPELVWAGSAYSSKQEFELYLKSNGLSYTTWLRRHPGMAPWEPGRHVSPSNEGDSEDRTTEILLAANAALLATLVALLLAHTTFRKPQRRDLSPRRDEGSVLVSAVAAGQHGIGHVARGASELVHMAATRLRRRPGSKEALIVYGVVLVLSLAAGYLVSIAL